MNNIFYGLHKTTLIDYPGEVAALLFTGGCNFFCPYCHNPELVKVPADAVAYRFDDIKVFLDKRRSVLGGVVISGGEPLLHREMPEIISIIKSMGLKVKIDTNGSFPDRLMELDVDYIAMDIKTAPEKYRHFCNNVDDTINFIEQSIKYIINSGIDHEFRTTMVPPLVDGTDLVVIAKMIEGSKRYFLNKYRFSKSLNPSYQHINPYSDTELLEFKSNLNSSGLNCMIR